VTRTPSVSVVSLVSRTPVKLPVIVRIERNTDSHICSSTGEYEDIKTLSDKLDQLEKDKGLDIKIHVDAGKSCSRYWRRN
jgi:hypothetical protein